MRKPLKMQPSLDAIVKDFRSRAIAMMALPPQSIGTGEMRVKASQMLRLLDELARLKQDAREPAPVQDNAVALAVSAASYPQNNTPRR